MQRSSSRCGLGFGLLVLLASLGLGCSPTVSLTLDVHTDLVPGEEFDVVRISVGGTERDVPAVASAIFVPTPQRYDAFSVAPGRVEIEVQLLRRLRPVLTRHLSLTVRENAVVPVWLLRSCLNVRCPDGADRSATECDDGRCVQPVCETEACSIPESCEADADCSAPTATCARASCVSGRCAAVAVPSACPMDSYCNPETGCMPRSMSVDAGPADAGGSDGGRDAGSDVPLDAPLPDCTTAADCPPPVVGGWTGCAFPSFCAESAADETRTTTTYTCPDGTCRPNDTVENRGCARSTSGLECAPPEMGPWGTCVYGFICPIEGVREATRTTHACAGGSCGSSSTVVRDSSGCPPFTEVCDLFDNDCDGLCDPGCRVPIARAYRDATTSHLFTQSIAEAMCCGFVLEQAAAFYTYGSNVGGGLIPLNRCYVPATNVHVYGTSGCEGVPGAVFEFAVGYISPTPVFCGATPLYRLTFGDRSFLTISAGEVSAAVGGGWTDRGVIGYVWTN